MAIIYTLLFVAALWWVMSHVRRLTPEVRIEKYEEIAEMMLRSYRVTNRVSFGQETDGPEVSRMKDWYIRLKEKYKHDSAQLLRFAEDWKDYTYCLSSGNSSIYLSLDTQDEGESQDYADGARKSFLRIEEIENRFADVLGQEVRRELEAERKKKQGEIRKTWGPEEPKEASDTVV